MTTKNIHEAIKYLEDRSNFNWDVTISFIERLEAENERYSIMLKQHVFEVFDSVEGDYIISVEGARREATIKGLILFLKLLSLPHLTVQEYVTKLELRQDFKTLEEVIDYTGELDIAIWDYPLSEIEDVIRNKEEEGEDYQTTLVLVTDESTGNLRICEL